MVLRRPIGELNSPLDTWRCEVWDNLDMCALQSEYLGRRLNIQQRKGDRETGRYKD